MAEQISGSHGPAWLCNVCGLSLSRKQRLLSHYEAVHSETPLPVSLQYNRKRYKLYEVDESVPVPKRTRFRLLSRDASKIENNSRHMASSSQSVQQSVIETFEYEREESDQDQEHITCQVYDSDQNLSEVNVDTDSQPTVKERCMAILSYTTKMKLTHSATNSLVKLINLLAEDVTIDAGDVKNIFGDMSIIEHSYCVKCNCVEQFCQCELYKGSGRFATAPITGQLVEIFKKIEIVNYLSKFSQITLLLNTDGIPLYSSSSVSLWPVYLVINELPPSVRFRKENVIVWGLWQGCGKPNFHTFFRPLVEELNELWANGVHIGTDRNETVKVKLTIISMDLQAKAYVMAMTQHNGQYGCVTCEHSGSVCKQGKGHARGYSPSEINHPQRSTDSILSNAADSILSKPKKAVKGIKGVSVLFEIDYFDPVDAVVPDYMHGVLLGTTKKLLTLWFNKENNKQPFYIGKSVGKVNARLTGMKPTDDVSRLPRTIDSVAHWKASEFESWLLFYSVPCLKDVLPAEHFENLCLLVSAVHILLSDSPSEEELNKAEKMLKDFYFSFELLYGTNNCGLNVHNIGSHIVYYVRKHGPMWGWSCFPFEDLNGLLVKAAHGTGHVCGPLVRFLLTHKKLHAEADTMKNVKLKMFTADMLTVGKRSGNFTVTENCKVLGRTTPYDVPREVLRTIAFHTGQTEEICSLSKAKRVSVNGQTILSKAYSRMKKRVCFAVLLEKDDDSLLCTVDYFVHESKSDTCFAVVRKLKVIGLVAPTVPHVLHVSESEDTHCCPVEYIQEKVMFLQGNENFNCIIRLPNLYGHTM